MFCLGCGAETPPRAAKCPVCGRDLGGTAGEVSYAISPTASGSALPVPSAAAPYQPLAAPYQPPAAPPVMPFSAGPSITRGDLDASGIPRDAYGRAALVTVIAMAADLLAPWVIEGATHRPIIAIGAPALAALPILGAALLPLISPALRRNPAYAALPMIIGGACAGAGGVLWAMLTYLSYHLSLVAVSLPSAPVFTPTAYTIGPDVGVYLFVLGGVVLLFTGYHVFLAAASARTVISVPPPTLMPAMPMFMPPSMLPPAPLPYAQAQPGAASQPMPAPGVAGAPYGPPGLPVAPSMPLAAPPAGMNGAVAASAEPGHEDGAEAGAQNGTMSIPLPGSAAWNEAPRQPGYVRPALGGGWQHGPRVRR